MQLDVQKIPWFLSWKGLLGQQPKPILLHTRFGIHTFGMRCPIDVVILDKFGTVRKMQHNLRPNRLFFWNPLYDIVVELPAGTIQEKGIKIGSHVSLTHNS